MTALAPINVFVGSQVINRAIIPIMETLPIRIKSYNLRPGSVAYHWFDDVSVRNYVQPVSYIYFAPNYFANQWVEEEGIYCAQTHAYATVVQNSQNQTLHIEENYHCLNLAKYQVSDTWAAGDYKANDIVFQATSNVNNIYANTFVGRVAFWDYANAAIALSTESGVLSNTNQTVLFKVGGTKLSNVSNIVSGDKFPVGARIISVANTAKFFLANSSVAYSHAHGPVRKPTSNLQIYLTGWNSYGTYIGKEIFIARGTGAGQRRLITGFDLTNGYATCNAAWSAISHDSYYGIGDVIVDDIGLASGIFHVPSDPFINFQTGARLVTVNDSLATPTDNLATMKATATFVAGGQYGTDGGTPVVPPTPIVPPAANTTTVPPSKTSSAIVNNGPVNTPAASPDPLVQTFFTPKSQQPGTDYGCFASSINLFFQSGPTGNSTQFPVSVYIVSTVNGYPTQNVLATATVRYENVNYTDGTTTFPDSANASTYTNFNFLDPVYLAPGTEYGIVVYSESPDYEVWISQLGQPVINQTRLVSQSPYVGSFFKSQNASAWTPLQDQQLMFVLNKAVFSTQAAALTFNVVPPESNTYVDILTVHSSDLTFPPATISYGIQSTTANGGVFDSTFKTVPTDVPYNFGGDLSNSSLNSQRRRIVTEGNADSMLVQVLMQTTNPDVSPFFHSEALTLTTFGNIVSPGGIDENSVTITAGGNHSNTSNITVAISAPTGIGGIQATANVAPTQLVANAVTGITIINPGAGYLKSPTINISEPFAGGTNAAAIVNGEDMASGGTAYARYITRPTTLAQGFAAGDLQVFLQAIRPQGTDIAVYYKVLSASDIQPISNVRWQLLNKAQELYSPDQQTPVNIVYNTGYNSLGVANGSVSYVQNGITYPLGGQFSTFQIKIVMTANDPTVPPEIQNLRAIAVPGG